MDTERRPFTVPTRLHAQDRFTRMTRHHRPLQVEVLIDNRNGWKYAKHFIGAYYEWMQPVAAMMLS